MSFYDGFCFTFKTPFAALAWAKRQEEERQLYMPSPERAAEFEAARLAEEGDEVVFLGQTWRRGPSYTKDYPHPFNCHAYFAVPCFDLLPLGDVRREPSLRCSFHNELPSWDHVYPTLGWRGQ